MKKVKGENRKKETNFKSARSEGKVARSWNRGLLIVINSGIDERVRKGSNSYMKRKRKVPLWRG